MDESSTMYKYVTTTELAIGAMGSNATNFTKVMLVDFTDAYFGHSDIPRIIFNTFIYGIISLAGIPANVVNTVVFFRMGMWTESSNVCLLGLAVADASFLVSMIWMGVLFFVGIIRPVGDLNWDPEGLLITSSIPATIFSQATCFITTYISLERCMCVVFPFQVKSWFSGRRSIVIVMCMFVSSFLLNLPYILAYSLTWVFNPQINRTYLTGAPTKTFDSAFLLKVAAYLNFAVIQTILVVMTTVSLVVTILRLKLSSTWRHTATSVGTKETSSPMEKQPENLQKERKLIKMVIVITAMFLVCFGPECVFNLLYTTMPELRGIILFRQVMNAFYFAITTIKVTSSSINIVIYYTLSTKYRQELRRMLGLNKDVKLNTAKMG